MRSSEVRRAALGLAVSLGLVICGAGATAKTSATAPATTRAVLGRWLGLAVDQSSQKGLEVLVELSEVVEGRADVRIESLGYNLMDDDADHPMVVTRAGVVVADGGRGSVVLQLPLFGTAKIPGPGVDRVTTTTRDPLGREWLLRLRRTNAASLVPRPRPQLLAQRWATRTDFFVERPGGVRIAGALYLPQGRGPFPTVVAVQDTATSSRAWPEGRGLALASELADLGVATVLLDDRGTGESGGAKSQTTYAESAEDLLAVAARVRSFAGVDASRLGLFGIGEGAVTAALAAAAPKAPYRRVALAAVATYSGAEYTALVATFDLGQLARDGAAAGPREVEVLRGLLVEAQRASLASPLPSPELAASLIPADLPQPLDPERVTRGLALAVDKVRSMSTPRLVSYQMTEPRMVLDAVRSADVPVLYLISTASKAPLVGDVERARRLVDDGGALPQVRLVEMDVTHVLVDAGAEGSGHEFDVSQVVSPRVTELLASWCKGELGVDRPRP